MRLNKAAQHFNVSTDTIRQYLKGKGIEVGDDTSKLDTTAMGLLHKEYKEDREIKQEASERNFDQKGMNTVFSSSSRQTNSSKDQSDDDDEGRLNIKSTMVGNTLSSKNNEDDGPESISHAKPGLKIVGKIELPPKNNSKGKEKPKTVDSVKKVVHKEQTTAPVEKKVETTASTPVKEPIKSSEVVEKKVVTTSQKQAIPSKDTPPSKDPVKLTKRTDSKDSGRNTNSSDRSSKFELNKSSDSSKNPERKVLALKKNKPGDEPTSRPTYNDRKETEKRVVKEKIQEEEDPEESLEIIEGRADKLKGLTILGTIDIENSRGGARGGKRSKNKKRQPVASSDGPKDALNREGQSVDGEDDDKKVRRPKKLTRKSDMDRTLVLNPRTAVAATAEDDENKNKSKSPASKGKDNKRKKVVRRDEVNEKEVSDQIRQTRANMTSTTSKQASRRNIRKEKRAAFVRAQEEEMRRQSEDALILRVTEFLSANELANLLDVPISEIIAKCMKLGTMISINQRLEADTISLLAEEYGYQVEFISAEEELDLEIEEDDEEDLVPRAPIVTIMGHVDHGKTTLLDYIRRSNVVASEAGGITQHIGAYKVKTPEGKEIAFIDTPGHEAFTAMRARGAKVTDVVIIVVAADDGVMPQTREAIAHAHNAGVPIVFAVNKIDRENANVDRIYQELADLGYLIEKWGGKYQSQEISAKKGIGIESLLELVLLEAELLDLKANPDRNAQGTIIEASLDKGRGYVATLLVETGTLSIGDIVLAGAHFGRVRAMMDYLGKKMKVAGPSTPVQILGLDGAPQAGDKFLVMENERDARERASKVQQIVREQSIRATKRLTLSDIGRRRALGNFQQLNLIVKGDVDGSVEALSDALLKLSTEEVEINIVHRAVGPVSESDVNLASASDAVLIAFQVRPSREARALAERDNIEIRSYSIIYQAIDEIKLAIEGMLAPEIEVVVVGRAEVRETFKISKVGTIAGCMILEGKAERNSKVKHIRNGIVMNNGYLSLSSLKRFKDDVSEVKFGYECGLTLRNYNELEIGDELEFIEEKEIKRKLN